jgi:hypothetical protein
MKVKFICDHYRGASCAMYQHMLIVLAEGLKELDISFWGNINYWFDHESKKFLIEKEKEYHGDADIYVYSSTLGESNTDFIKNIDLSKINVVLDDQDGWASPSMDNDYAPFDLVLTCHYNKFLEKNTLQMKSYEKFRTNYLPNVRPWAFGISNRIIQYNAKYYHLMVEDKVLLNYRVEHNLRTILTTKLSSIISKWSVYYNITSDPPNTDKQDKLSYWSQTGRRHHEQYFKDLNTSLFTMAFGGVLFFKPTGNDLFAKLHLKLSRLITKFQRLIGVSESINLTHIMSQFDNWRFIESMLSNSIPLHIDYDYWNICWPVNPIDGKHYIAVKGLNLKQALEKMESMSEVDLQNIRIKGREWAIENYGPKATAERFLKYIRELKK